MKRCDWAKSNNQLYLDYHDTEWGVPVRDDRTLFEFLILEGAQAGLSWSTILQKRNGYKRIFKNFDVQKVSEMTDTEVEKVLLDPGIVRNRLKVTSAIANAKHFIAVQKEFGSFSNYLWNFVDDKPIRNTRKKMSDIPAITPAAKVISKDLKKRGFTFIGPTIVYAYMQAMGMVNDHVSDCFRYKEINLQQVGS